MKSALDGAIASVDSCGVYAEHNHQPNWRARKAMVKARRGGLRPVEPRRVRTWNKTTGAFSKYLR